MILRYGKGIVDPERLAAAKLNSADHAAFAKFLANEGPGTAELYRQAVKSSFMSANEVRTDVAAFFGLPEANLLWSADEHRKALTYWGATPSQVENVKFPPKTRAEDLM